MRSFIYWCTWGSFFLLQSFPRLKDEVLRFKVIAVRHCCYQGAFQEVNILINRAYLVNVKLVLTESLYGKNYFSKTIKVISNLTNRYGTVLSGQTFVQKWLLDYGHFHGQIWPFFTLMAIFTHQTVGRIVRIRPRAAHRGEEDSHKKNQFVPLNFSMCH